MSAHPATPRSSRISSTVKPKKPSIVITPTPTHAKDAAFGRPLTNTWTPISPILIPPPATAQQVRIALSTSQIDRHVNAPRQSMSASNIASPDLIALAELFAAMKRTLTTLGTTFDSLGKQTEKMASLAPVVKAAEQIDDTRTELQEQIRRQEASMQAVSILLENAVKDSVVDRLKEQIFADIQETVAKEVKERVQCELAARIPTHLRQQVQDHTRQRLEVQTSIYNSEARRHNANIRPTQPLRPLLRPLPTPQQSPTCIVKRMLPPTTPMDPSPLSAFPRLKVPAPTPIATSSHCLMIPGGSNQYIQVTPPTPSPLFPRDLKSLFALGPDAARRLLRDYGIDGKDEQSPATDEPCPKAAPRSSIPESPIGSPLESDDEHHEQRIHRFMFHIGVRPPPSGPKSHVTERPKLHVVIPGAKLASVPEAEAQ